MATRKSTTEQPAVQPKTPADPVARIIERATSNPTAIQLQFMDWAVEQAEAHGLTFKSEKEREQVPSCRCLRLPQLPNLPGDQERPRG